MNSIYGVMAFPKFRFYDHKLSVEIAKKGRYILEKTINFCDQNCGSMFKTVYADTDSIILVSKISIEKFKLEKKAEEIKNQINKDNTAIMIKIEYIFDAILIVNKKQYISFREETSKLDIKGLAPIKRDVPEIVKEQYLNIVNIIFYNLNKFLYSANKKNTLNSLLNYEELIRNIKNCNNFKKFSIKNKLGKNIEKYNKSGLRFIELLQKLNINKRKGDIIEWIKTENGEEIFEKDKSYRIDYEYYVSLLESNLTQLTNNCFNFKSFKNAEDEIDVSWKCKKCNAENSIKKNQGHCYNCGLFLCFVDDEIEKLSKVQMWFILCEYIERIDEIPIPILTRLKEESGKVCLENFFEI